MVVQYRYLQVPGYLYVTLFPSSLVCLRNVSAVSIPVLNVPYTTVYQYIAPPLGAVFQGRLLDSQEGANTECYLYVFRKLCLGEMLRTPTFGYRHNSNCGNRSWKSAQGRLIFTILYGKRISEQKTNRKQQTKNITATTASSTPGCSSLG